MFPSMIQSHYTIEYTSNQKEASQECNTCLYLICMLWQSEPPLKRMLRCLQWSLWHFPSILINTLIHIFSNVKNVRIYGQQILLSLTELTSCIRQTGSMVPLLIGWFVPSHFCILNFCFHFIQGDFSSRKLFYQSQTLWKATFITKSSRQPWSLHDHRFQTFYITGSQILLDNSSEKNL